MSAEPDAAAEMQDVAEQIGWTPLWDASPAAVRHENHDRPGADITDCRACMREASAKGVDW